MRLAVLSDIHGNLTALDAVLDDLKSVGDVDLIWCLGDYVAFGTQPAQCMQRLHALLDEQGKEKIKFIGGNTDRYITDGVRPKTGRVEEDAFGKLAAGFGMRDEVLNWNLAQLRFADYEFLTKINGRELRTHIASYGHIIGAHAIPGDDEAYALAPDSADEMARDALLDRGGRLALVGHTHKRMDRDLGNWRVINPGSVGMSYTLSGRAEWLLLTFDGDDLQLDWRDVPYDVEAVIAQASQVGYPHPDFLAGRLRNAGS